MPFAMYVGFVVGLLAAAIMALVATDARTRLVKVGAFHWAALAITVVSFVIWVTGNVLRHMGGQEIRFFSPWGIVFGCVCLVFVCARWFESWKVADNSAVPDQEEIEKVALCVAASLLTLGTVVTTAGGRIEESIANVLIGVMALGFGATIMFFARVFHLRSKTRER
jgi:cytochrome b561